MKSKLPTQNHDAGLIPSGRFNVVHAVPGNRLESGTLPPSGKGPRIVGNAGNPLPPALAKTKVLGGERPANRPGSERGN
jgi:hypothetical protein